MLVDDGVRFLQVSLLGNNFCISLLMSYSQAMLCSMSRLDSWLKCGQMVKRHLSSAAWVHCRKMNEVVWDDFAARLQL